MIIPHSGSRDRSSTGHPKCFQTVHLKLVVDGQSLKWSQSLKGPNIAKVQSSEETPKGLATATRDSS